MNALTRRCAVMLALVSPGLLVGACAGPAAAPPGAAAMGSAAMGSATIAATLQLSGPAGRRLQKVVPVWTAADVAVVDLRLYTVVGQVETQVAAVSVPASALEAPATFSRLRANTAYRLRASAFKAGGRTASFLISDDATSVLDVATTTEDRPVWAAVPVRLADVPFDGMAVLPAATITDGQLIEGLRGMALTFAGSTSGWSDDEGRLAQFNSPKGLLLDGSGSLLVLDAGNHRIRAVDVDGVVTTFAGDGTAGLLDGQFASARLNAPSDIATNGEGFTLLTDGGNHAVRAIDELTGEITTWAGGNGSGFLDHTTGLSAQFAGPQGLEIDGTDAYVADTGNHRIRLVSGAAGNAVSTIAGGAAPGLVDDATGANARFNAPHDVAMAWPYLYVADTSNHGIRRIKVDDPAFPVSLVAGGGLDGFADGDGLAARFSSPRGLALDSSQMRLYIADSGNHSIRVMDLNDPLFAVKTLVGGTLGATDGLGAEGRFSTPTSLAFDYDGSLLVGDAGNHRIRRVR